MNSSSPQPAIPPESGVPPEVKQAVDTLRLTGWSSFWLQLAIAVISLTILLLALFGRNINEESNSAFLGVGIFFAGCSIVALAFSIFLALRQVRYGRRLRRPEADLHPSKSETVKLTEVFLIANLVGLSLATIGSEVSTGVLLAKAISQPQGAAIYTPDKVIRVLDILVVIANTNLVVAHTVGVGAAIWLVRRIR
ncbi:MAG: DUF3611 family protein [Leptolyngbya sp. SIO4C5]|uniref:DUF3611 family protein n=1 Tax=Sphaerothrix gracilis TaxID=3151835 RepID=UPI0013C1A10A|nr:DUF3611 family protein [Leptolyngbya sp. SIO4C5]